MSKSESDTSRYSMNKTLSDFSNEFKINTSSLTIFPPAYNSFIQISPNNEYMAFVQNNMYKIFKKTNNTWAEKFSKELPFGEKKIKGINWSPNNKMFLVYGDNNEHKSLIKAINLDNLDWKCEIEFNENINHSSFYPDSMNIVYIKSIVNILNIFYLLKYTNLNSKNKKDKIKNEYYFLKYDDERCINYLEHNNNIFMILPCFGRRNYNRENSLEIPKDFIIMLVNKKVLKYFPLKTYDLERIIPLRNKYSFFIAVEREFYKHPFYIYNLYGEIMYKSYFENQDPRLLTNPCLLNNKYYETNFLIVQEPNEGKLSVFGCQTILHKTNICFYYEYNKLFDYIEKKKKKKNNHENYKNINVDDNRSKNNCYNISFDNYIFDNYINQNDILFLEEQTIYYNKKSENIIDNGSDISIYKNPIRKLIKVNPFNINICNNEDDYQLHAEISPIKNYICYINKKYPYYLFFGSYYQSGVFKIIKFINNILSFKWSTQQDLILVTFESCSYLYFITKDNYLNYNLGEKEYYNFDNIVWSSSGKDVLISNEEKNIRLVASLY